MGKLWRKKLGDLAKAVSASDRTAKEEQFDKIERFIRRYMISV